MNKCKKCGNDSFFVSESYVYTACLVEGILTVETMTPKTGGMDNAICRKCDTEYEPDDFYQIDFCA